MAYKDVGGLKMCDKETLDETPEKYRKSQRSSFAFVDKARFELDQYDWGGKSIYGLKKPNPDLAEIKGKETAEKEALDEVIEKCVKTLRAVRKTNPALAAESSLKLAKCYFGRAHCYIKKMDMKRDDLWRQRVFGRGAGGLYETHRVKARLRQSVCQQRARLCRESRAGRGPGGPITAPSA
jgi:hypothetical protein